MLNLIQHLAQLLLQDNAILFVGANLRATRAEETLLQRVTDALAAQVDYKRPDRTLAAVARDVEALQGRPALLLALQEVVKQLDNTPSALHSLIAEAMLSTTKVITTRFDHGLERALDQYNKRYVTIVRDTDIANYDETLITLIKMQGDINQPDSLVLTDDDINDFIDKLSSVNDVIRGLFATKTLIFLGYDLPNPQFKRLFQQVTHKLTLYRRAAYAIVDQPLDEVEVRYWRNRNVEMQQWEPTTFLQTLSAAIKELTPNLPRVRPNPLAALVRPPLPAQPYKGLISYTSGDALIFAGRREASQRLAQRILAHRLVVVDGASGTGKTSLIQAGAGPVLAKERVLLITCAPAPGQSLEKLLYQALVTACQQADLPLPGAELTPGIRAWQQAHDAPVVLVIDQFEQFFLLYNKEEQQAAIDFLAGLVANHDLNLRLVLVIRDDFFSQLQTLEEDIPNLMAVRFHLERLGRDAAQAAIEEPAQAFAITWEPGLVQRLLDDLYDEKNGGVAAPQLQIVCDRLAQILVNPGEKADEPAVITLQRFNELGGTAGILRGYLSNTVADFTPSEQPAIRQLLGALVSSRGVKQRLTLADIARTANLPLETAAPLLNALTQHRLLQRYAVPDLN